MRRTVTINDVQHRIILDINALLQLDMQIDVSFNAMLNLVILLGLDRLLNFEKTGIDFNKILNEIEGDWHSLNVLVELLRCEAGKKKDIFEEGLSFPTQYYVDGYMTYPIDS